MNGDTEYKYVQNYPITVVVIVIEIHFVLRVVINRLVIMGYVFSTSSIDPF